MDNFIYSDYNMLTIFTFINAPIIFGLSLS